MKQMQVIKGSGGTYTLFDGKEQINAVARGNLKENKVLIGDFVETQEINGKIVILAVKERKNQLIRPVVSNIDKMCIVLAPSPKPDLSIVDKQLLKCYQLGINPLICINKTDIAETEFVEEIKQIYSFVDVAEISAKEGIGINQLVNKLKGGLTALCGQSAVGKSSLINCLDNNKNLKTDGLCAKTERGKHTTKHSEIHILDEDLLIIDTPGFSSLDIVNIEPSEIAYLMPDFVSYSTECKFQPCTHITEPTSYCAVKQALGNNKISLSRYNNYVEIFNSIKPEWEKKKRDVKNPSFSFNTPRKKRNK